MPDLLQAALLYSKIGWRVFPVRPDKKPYTAHGVHDATVDPAVITKWWTQFPSAAIGLACGSASGVVALDVDAGHDGFASLDALLAQFGPLPRTATSITGGGGRHYLFQAPATERTRNTRGELGDGLDTRGDGGYIILPPSKHASGNLYAWDIDPLATPPASMPQWLHDFMIHNRAPVSIAPAALSNPLATSEPIPEGGRNDTLFRAASVLRAQALEYDEIFERISDLNTTRCVPPLPPEEIATICRSVCRYEPGRRLVEEATPEDDPTTWQAISGGRPVTRLSPRTPEESDLGNAWRMAERFGADIRHVKAWGKWLIWSGTHWRVSDTAEIERMAHETVLAIHEEVTTMRGELASLSAELELKNRQQAASVTADGMLSVDLSALDPLRNRVGQLSEHIKALSKHARDSQSDRALKAMVKQCSCLAGIDIPAAQLDADPFLFNCPNGTIDLRTSQLRPHDRGDLITKCAPVPYDPDAMAPRWVSFLTEIMQGDLSLVSYLQRAVGYSLTGSVSSQVLFFLHGDGRNGKSTFINVLRSLLGPYSIVAAHTLLEEGERHSTELADLAGRRVAIISETDEGKALPQAQIKRLTSEEAIRARRMREDNWEFQPQHKLWISGNHRPTIRGSDLGIWRRIQLIPFRYTIPADSVDPELPAVLAAELPGILAWAMSGAIAYRTGGLKPPLAVTEAVEEYRNDQDIIGEFADECLERGPGYSASSGQVYARYQIWAEANGYRVMHVKAFKERMERHATWHRTNSTRLWLGIRLPPTGPTSVSKQ